MRVEIIRAWPRRFELLELDLPEGSSVDDAIAQAGWSDDEEIVAFAVYGHAVRGETLLQQGDRLELLRPLSADPKDARRQRALSRRNLVKP